MEPDGTVGYPKEWTMPWCISKRLSKNSCISITETKACILRNGAPLADIDEGFESGTEITFNCIKGVAGERTTWKIVCEDGAWVGRSLNCGEFNIFFNKMQRKQSNFVLYLANGTCIFWNNEPNVVSFYNDLEIREEVVEFPAGATIVSR